jgi:hypothetical protein
MLAPSVCENAAAATAASRFIANCARSEACLATLVERGVAGAIVALAMQPAVAASAAAATALAAAAEAVAFTPAGAAALERAGADVVLNELCCSAPAVYEDAGAAVAVANAVAVISMGVAAAAADAGGGAGAGASAE